MKTKYLPVILCITVLIPFGSGCVSTSGTALETHKKGLGGITENEYLPAKKPIDKHFIGAAWSRQFGPVDDPTADEVRIKKERSFSSVQQDYAYNLGLALGATPVAAPVKGEIGIQGGSVEKARLEGLEIISPVTLADIPFEPDILYVTEALRLTNFKIKDEKSNKAGINVGAGNTLGTATSVAEAGSQARRGTEGDGLVVAYKLQSMDKGSYEKKDTGSLALPLNTAVELPLAALKVTAGLQTIEPGSGKSLPRNILWACPRADAQSKNMIAAWIIEVKSFDPKRKSLTIGFPALPRIDDCRNFEKVIFSKIDPRTDKILRQKLNILVVDAEVTDFLQPKLFESRITLVEEMFKIQTVNPAEM